MKYAVINPNEMFAPFWVIGWVADTFEKAMNDTLEFEVDQDEHYLHSQGEETMVREFHNGYQVCTKEPNGLAVYSEYRVIALTEDSYQLRDGELILPLPETEDHEVIGTYQWESVAL